MKNIKTLALEAAIDDLLHAITLTQKGMDENSAEQIHALIAAAHKRMVSAMRWVESAPAESLKLPAKRPTCPLPAGQKTRFLLHRLLAQTTCLKSP